MDVIIQVVSPLSGVGAGAACAKAGSIRVEEEEGSECCNRQEAEGKHMHGGFPH